MTLLKVKAKKWGAWMQTQLSSPPVTVLPTLKGPVAALSQPPEAEDQFAFRWFP